MKLGTCIHMRHPFSQAFHHEWIIWLCWPLHLLSVHFSRFDVLTPIAMIPASRLPIGSAKSKHQTLRLRRLTNRPRRGLLNWSKRYRHYKHGSIWRSGCAQIPKCGTSKTGCGVTHNRQIATLQSGSSMIPGCLFMRHVHCMRHG